jgi:hypothetical protein
MEIGNLTVNGIVRMIALIRLEEGQELDKVLQLFTLRYKQEMMKMVRFLLGRGADISKQEISGKYGHTPCCKIGTYRASQASP